MRIIKSTMLLNCIIASRASRRRSGGENDVVDDDVIDDGIFGDGIVDDGIVDDIGGAFQFS